MCLRNCRVEKIRVTRGRVGDRRCLERQAGAGHKTLYAVVSLFICSFIHLTHLLSVYCVIRHSEALP